MHLNSMYKNIAMFFILIIITFLVSQKNILGSAPDVSYGYFQHDSEALVIGRIAADTHKLRMPKDANLGSASIIDFKYEQKYIYQSYSLINNKKIPDYTIKSEEITDNNWSKGLARTFAGVVVKNDDRLDDYIGRTIILPNEDRRKIMAIDHSENYANLYLTGSIISSNSLEPSITLTLSGDLVNSDIIRLTPYVSQYGIQGAIFSKIYNNFIPKINVLYYINSLAFAITISTLVLLYRKTISVDFAVIFFLTIILSPWIVSFARNLYWIPFTWFLPAVFAGFYFLAQSIRRKIFLAALIYFSFVLKCLAGYEYISSIILLAAAIFSYELFNPERVLTKSQSVKGFFLICLLGVAGFSTALLMHANMRGDTLIEGIKSIYEFDVKRRTYGDPNSFGSENYEALSSSILMVLKTYIFTWHTEFLKGFPGFTFYMLCILSMATIFYRYYAAHQNKARDASLFIAFLMPPLSWFILAKSHSAQHTHMSYVLWYFGFAACILSISLNGFKIAIIHITSWAKTANPEKI